MSNLDELLPQEIGVTGVAWDQHISQCHSTDTIAFLGEPNDPEGHTERVVVQVEPFSDGRIDARESPVSSRGREAQPGETRFHILLDAVEVASQDFRFEIA
jgi:hypothetical protein